MKKCILWSLIFVALLAVGTSASDRPNFIFIYADDLGWGDLGCYGHTKLKTPYLDKMAKDGLLLTNFVSVQVIC